VVALYVRPLSKKDTTSPPSSFGAGAMYTDSESWAAGGIVKLRFSEARDRVDVGFGGFEFNYDFFGVGSEAGDRGIGIPITQQGALVKVEYLTRIVEGLFIGPRYRIMDTTTGLDLGAVLPPELEFPQLEFDVATAYLGLHLRYDTRDFEYNPGKGRLADFGANFFEEAFGSDYTFQGYDASYNHYLSLKEDERRIIAVRGTACDVRGDAPFFELCALGMQDAFRGYPGGRYRDSASVTAQAEYRWRFYKRWGMVVFGGLGEVAPALNDLRSGNIIPSLGLGARFLVATENRINVRVDYAWGEDSQALYISVGEAF
jgi:outer membrane protein assembly factor BamA